MPDEQTKWQRIWAGERPSEPAGERTEPAPQTTSWDPPSAAKVTATQRPPLPRMTRTGYWFAALTPYIGLLYGAALVARGDDDGANVMIWSVVSLICWAVAAGVILAATL